MQLNFSLNSPFARVVRVAAIECGLSDSTEFIEVVNRTPDNPLLAFSPVGRVPTLVDGELILGEARNICGYFDDLTGRTQLLGDDAKDWPAIGFESMAQGFLDAVGVWVRERRRKDHEISEFILQVEKDRAERCIGYFETQVARLKWDFGGIAIGCALGILEHNDMCEGWRTRAPSLAAWYDVHAGRAAMQQTRPR